jgi:hypothetical protein
VPVLRCPVPCRQHGEGHAGYSPSSRPASCGIQPVHEREWVVLYIGLRECPLDTFISWSHDTSRTVMRCGDP